MNTGLLDDLCGAEGVVGINVHTEALGDASHVAAYITEGEDTQLLTQQLGTALTVVETTNGHHEQTEYEFGNGIGVLTWGILGNYVVSGSCGEVDIVVTSTGTNNNLQLLGSVEHFGIDLIRTDDECVGILYCVEQLCLFSIFLEQCQLIAGSFYFIPVGIENPKLVYDVFRAYQNWYHDDVALRDDPEELEWWYTTTSDKLDLQEWNFEIMKKMGEKTVVDFAGTVLGEMPLVEFINGDLTPAQLQEEYKQVVQDTLDQIFGA